VAASAKQKMLSRQTRAQRSSPTSEMRLKFWEGLTVKAERKLEQLIDSPNENIAYNASVYVINRTQGTPRQQAVVDVRASDLTAQHLEALRQWARDEMQQVIDITPQKALDSGA